MILYSSQIYLFIQFHAEAKRHTMREIMRMTRERFGVCPSTTSIRRQMSKRGVDMQYSAGYRARFVAAARKAPHKSAREIIESIGPDAAGRYPSDHGVRNWLASAGITTKSQALQSEQRFASGLRARVLDLSRDGMKPAEIVSTIAAEFPGEIPSAALVGLWRYKAGLTRKSTRVRAPRRVRREPVGRDAYAEADSIAPAETPQWVRDQMILAAAWSENRGAERALRSCGNARRLWWSPEQSNNPRWNPNAAGGRRMAA